MCVHLHMQMSAHNNDTKKATELPGTHTLQRVCQGQTRRQVVGCATVLACEV